jgi:hypothetical protein
VSGTTDFVFKARGEFDASGRLVAAVVRYDGPSDVLQRAASHVGNVTVREAKADKNGNPRIRLTGSNVQSALSQYAQRAATYGSYRIGDV